jgi:hypothetical protein
MRCKNCGWENPDEKGRCEKCDSLLEGIAQEPLAVKYPSGADPDAKKTLTGCLQCGYPLRASDQRCPNCDYPVAENEAHLPSAMTGTVMAGMDTVDKQKEGRKLVGLLVGYSLHPQGEFFPVFEGRNYIGRDRSSDICLQGDSLISGKHVSILYRGIDQKFKFRDEQSSNGTFINEQLLDEGELQNYDVIRIGSTQWLFLVIPAF